MVTCQSCNLAYDLVLVSNWFMQKDFEMQLAVVKVDGGGHPKPNRLVPRLYEYALYGKSTRRPSQRTINIDIHNNTGKDQIMKSFYFLCILYSQ